MRRRTYTPEQKERRKIWRENYVYNRPQDVIDRFNSRRKRKRHLLGISKLYLGEYKSDGERKKVTPEKKRLYRKRYKYSRKQAGKLSIKTIQMVYEDNIKKHGTLTCYLCLLPVLFGKDHLEHKIPLSRGGTNEYNNLSIACQKCNCSKHDKTEEEYKTWRKNKAYGNLSSSSNQFNKPNYNQQTKQPQSRHAA